MRRVIAIAFLIVFAGQLALSRGFAAKSAIHPHFPGGRCPVCKRVAEVRHLMEMMGQAFFPIPPMAALAFLAMLFLAAAFLPWLERMTLVGLKIRMNN
ncbi:MAG: hypothetical protein LBC41_01035 [Clostridiales bacterium]|nr:hypothetical protein [Clostridiales bacterium]